MRKYVPTQRVLARRTFQKKLHRDFFTLILIALNWESLALPILQLLLLDYIMDRTRYSCEAEHCCPRTNFVLQLLQLMFLQEHPYYYYKRLIVEVNYLGTICDSLPRIAI